VCVCQNIELLDKDSERLQHLLRWRELEGVFWKWMESVIDAKQAAASSVGGAAGNSISGKNNIYLAHPAAANAIPKLCHFLPR